MIDYDVSDGLCVLRLNSPPVNAISPAMLAELRARIERAGADGRVAGIVITGGQRQFSAGADVGLFRQIASPEEAVEISRTFQEAFQAVEDSAKPVAAALAGSVMGSAVELAAACHWRICEPACRLSMPEVRLDINPGAGGTQRLPRLVGLPAALRMLLTAEAVGAGEALRIGLVDAVCGADALIATAGRLVASGGVPPRTSRRADKLADAAANAIAFADAEALLRHTRAELLAPRRIVQAVRAGLDESLAAALRAEREAFAACMEGPAARNRIYLFFATREAGKFAAPAGAKPQQIASAAVVGMGSMGSGIAQALLAGGLPVVALDSDSAALARGAERIRGSLQRRVAAGKLTAARADEMLARLTTTCDWSALAAADIVIEAVVEDAAVKRSVIASAEGVCRDSAVIATNTSTISLEELAAGMRHPGRLVGMHFFNPAHAMPLVEVIRRDSTDPGAIAAVMALAKTIRKTPVLVRNREGFLVNRIFVPYFKEAFSLLEDGAEPADIDRAMVEFGFPMGPLALIDMAGLDILADVDKVMSRAFPRHGGLSAIAVQLVEQGHLGQKTGAGVYRYEQADRRPRESAAAARIIADVRAERGPSRPAPDAGEITRRLVLRMVCEAFCVLEEGLAQRESDVDVAMVLATAFPDFRGGVVRYARGLGLANVAAQLDELAGRLGPRFAPCRLLRETKGT